MKKFVSVLLAAASLLSSAAAESTFSPATSYDSGERTFNAGTVKLESAGQSAHTISRDVYAGTPGKDYTDPKVYTLNDYTSGIGSSMNWDPLSWETSEDSNITDFIVTPFYVFRPNPDLTGYAIQPELAADYPVDVTSEYVGEKYSIAEGETGRAFRIALNRNAVWEDGTPINADDFVYSMQQQLNPKMLNRRADSWYDGTFSICNAKNYLYAGQTVYTAIGDQTAASLLSSGTVLYLDMEFWGVSGAMDADGNAAPRYVPVTDDTMYRDASVSDESDAEAWVSAKYLYENYLADDMPYAAYQGEYLCTASAAKAVTWDDVGFKKIDDYTIDFILEYAVADPDFYVPYNLSSSFLVNRKLYESCKSFFKNGQPVATEEEADEVTSTYCKTLATTISFGPYRLSSFELDKEYTLTRNESWYGYSDGKHLGQYQADNYVVTVIAEHATAMMAFEKGEIDAIGLQSDDMSKYASSSYIHYGPNNGYTTQICFNTDYEKLLAHGTGSQILAVDEFREGFSYALDRTHFATEFTAAGTAGFGLINEAYCYDPFSGALFRDNKAAKKGMVDLYGVTYGPDGDYETLDEAYAAMTGYDMDKAKQLMAAAAGKAVDAGIWDGESPITLEFLVYNSDTIYNQMFNYLNAQLQEACAGSPFEGKLTLTMTVDADYYNTMASGNTDIIFSTWGGALMNPFTTIAQCYCDASDGSGNQMTIGYDTTAIAMTFTFEGEAYSGDVTASLHDWANWFNNSSVDSITPVLGAAADYSYDTRCAVYAAVEECYLKWHTTLPLYYRNLATLNSQKVNFVSDTYISMIGFGDISDYTFNYSDDEWADYIANNTLQY